MTTESTVDVVERGVETPEVETPTAPTAPTVGDEVTALEPGKPYAGNDPTVAQFSPLLLGKQADYVKAAAELKDAEGDRDAQLKAYVTDSDDAAAVKLRNVIEEATKRLTALAEEKVPANAVSDETKEALKANLTAIKSNIASARAVILDFGKTNAVDFEGVMAWLNANPNPSAGRRMGQAGGSSGEGKGGYSGPRYRADHVVNGGDPNDPMDNDKAGSFGELSKLIKADSMAVRQAFADTNGVPLAEISQKVKGVTNWSFKAGNVTYTIVTTPRV